MSAESARRAMAAIRPGRRPVTGVAKLERLATEGERAAAAAQRSGNGAASILARYMGRAA